MPIVKTPMPRIAIATCIDRPGLTPDDELLAPALASAGINWSAVPWNENGVDWTKFDGILIRSTWDYHEQLDAFLGWIGQIEKAGVLLWNSPDALRWSVNKNYLRDLEAAGVPTIPTVWVQRGTDNVELPKIMASNGWTEVVVKPAISAGGRGLRRYDRNDAGLAGDEQVEAARRSDLLIQPFLPEITRGELSFILFDGTISHVVRKTPRPGDYRVQAKFGGSIELASPDTSIMDQALVAASSRGKQLYARVDGLQIDGRLIVTEVELVEPDLFLHIDPEAASRLTNALKRSLVDLKGRRV